LRVSVPVLSEQITVTDPSDSTAGSRRTIALRRAIRCTPIASTMVSAAGSPSGIAATASPTAAMNICSGAKPRPSVPIRKVAVASSRIATVSQRPKVSSLASSGVRSASTEAISAPIRPSSVARAVATTTPTACPCVTTVPACAMQWRSPISVSGGTASIDFATASDSPVSADSSTCSERTSISLRSAPTLSPDCSSTRSPGTSSVAGTSRARPSRSTVARGDSSARIASSDRSALPSWISPITALTSTTATMTPASIHWPSTAVRSAAASRT
jgi:hypothetical protein